MKRGLHKLIQHVAGRHRQTLDRQSRLIFFYLDPFAGGLEPFWPMNNPHELKAPSIVLIQNCLKRERGLQVHDAAVDPQLGGVEGGDFRSAVCVPLFDKDGTVMGVIYIDHPEVGELGKQERLEAERLARKLQPRMPKWTKAAAQQATKEPEEETVFSPWTVLVATGLVLFFCVAWLAAPETPGEKREASGSPTPQVTRVPADDALRTFLALITVRQEKQAWEILSPELQERVPVETFVSGVQTWMADSANRWDFDRREQRQVSGEEGTFYLDPTEALKEAKSWKLRFEETDGQWRLVEASGGPFDFRESAASLSRP